MQQDRRQDHDQLPSPRPPNAETAWGALGSAHGHRAGHHGAGKAGQGGGRITPFWRIFGTTLLSIAALVVVTLTQQFANVLTEVRQDLNRLHESHGEMARKEEVGAAFKDLQAATGAIAALRERSLLLEQQLKAAEEEHKELTREMRQQRERLAEVVGRESAWYTAGPNGGPQAGRHKPAGSLKGVTDLGPRH